LISKLPPVLSAAFSKAEAPPNLLTKFQYQKHPGHFVLFASVIGIIL